MWSFFEQKDHNAILQIVDRSIRSIHSTLRSPMSTRQFKIYAPLQDFIWNGVDFEIMSGLRISRFNQRPDLQGLDATLAEDEQTDAFFNAHHWLNFQWQVGTEPSPAEIVNLVLVALWLVKPTRSHVAFRFELGQEAAADYKRRYRLFDRFAWVPNATHEEFNDSDLQSVSSYYPALREICCARRRLNDALILTLTGCWSHQWQSALICHAADAEMLLTYSTGRGITHRLAISYACLVETQRASRDAAYKEFYTLYSVRSDIMHGRSHNVRSSERLPFLGRFQNVLRMLWRAAISSPQAISIFEGSDAQREAYFSQLTSGYTPPRHHENQR